MKVLMTGNEAVARGAYEAGVSYASAYPGTPSTEILENIALYQGDIIAEWAPNEKVALETAIGASIAGARSLAAMKHVGLNVAADPLLTFAYTGVNGGLVLISADDPGMHSSQNEQDNRYYAKFAKLPMLEPSNSQEAKDMVVAALAISEAFDAPVLLRTTTRVNHSKTLVEWGPVQEAVKKPYVKDILKYDAKPAVARKLHGELEEKLLRLEAFSNETAMNATEWHDKTVGVIAAGIAYEYVREVFGETASYLKIGFSYPLPMEKIRAFAAAVGTLYVVEELEPFMEEQIRAAGIPCIGKAKVPRLGELNTDILRQAFFGTRNEILEYDKADIAARPPVLCAGCPHRGFFYELAKRKQVMITGDIGCYGLGSLEPLNAMDTSICMGASVSMGHGAQQVFAKFGEPTRTVAVLGDSTFFHSGMTGLINTVYNRSNSVVCILDNRITGMTGHQENPGSGFKLQGQETQAVEIEPLVRALGVAHVRVINPLKLQDVGDALDWALALDEPAVIITRWPCVLKKMSLRDKTEFGDWIGTCTVAEADCIGCKRCIKTGCPALQYNPDTKKVRIDGGQCAGCEVCLQTCPKQAIRKGDH